MLLLLALTGCLESVVALAPLRVTAVSGALLAVPPLLAFGGGRCGVGREAEGEIAVKMAALEIAMTVIARKERLEVDSLEGQMMWG